MVGLAASIAAGCKAGSDGGQLAILFPRMYSAYDGNHIFQLPATVQGVAGVKWSASDPSMVDLQPDATGSIVVITMKKAGTVDIRASAGGLEGSAPLIIDAAGPDDWENGNQRYNNGIVPAMRMRDDAGMWSSPDAGETRTMQACANCHARGGQDIEHTPTQSGGYSDEELIAIMTEGKKPAGVAQRVVPYDQWHRTHQWAMTEEEEKGLIVYLRALTPMSQGLVDFGGRGSGSGGGGNGGGGGGGGGSGGGGSGGSGGGGSGGGGSGGGAGGSGDGSGGGSSADAGAL